MKDKDNSSFSKQAEINNKNEFIYLVKNYFSDFPQWFLSFDKKVRISFFIVLGLIIFSKTKSFFHSIENARKVDIDLMENNFKGEQSLSFEEAKKRFIEEEEKKLEGQNKKAQQIVFKSYGNEKIDFLKKFFLDLPNGFYVKNNYFEIEFIKPEDQNLAFYKFLYKDLPSGVIQENKNHSDFNLLENEKSALFYILYDYNAFSISDKSLDGFILFIKMYLPNYYKYLVNKFIGKYDVKSDQDLFIYLTKNRPERKNYLDLLRGDKWLALTNFYSSEIIPDLDQILFNMVPGHYFRIYLSFLKSFILNDYINHNSYINIEEVDPIDGFDKAYKLTIDKDSLLQVLSLIIEKIEILERVGNSKELDKFKQFKYLSYIAGNDSQTYSISYFLDYNVAKLLDRIDDQAFRKSYIIFYLKDDKVKRIRANIPIELINQYETKDLPVLFLYKMSSDKCIDIGDIDIIYLKNKHLRIPEDILGIDEIDYTDY